MLAIILGGAAVPSGATPVQAGSSCTGWASTLVPPRTIRVYRTSLHRVETVDFKRYVQVVMANEWGPTNPAAALRAGAIAVKQYGWYYARTWRGGSAGGRCYDVKDSTADQVYNPSRRVPASIVAAVQATWQVSLRRDGRLFATGYRAGTGRCTSELSRGRLFQRDASNCVRTRGDSWETLLRRFYRGVAVVTTGVGDSTGDGVGDAQVALANASSGSFAATLYASDRVTPAAATQWFPTPGLSVAAAPDRVIAQATGDVNGDGLTDVMTLLGRADGSYALDVQLSTGTGFAAPVAWWSSGTTGLGRAAVSEAALLDGATVRLVEGDFNADGLVDVGIVRLVGGAAPASELWVAESNGHGFGRLHRYWSQAVDLTQAGAFAALDVTGDGRADLAFVQDVPGAPQPTAQIEVARSVATRSSHWITTATTWLTLPGAAADVRPVVSDVNADGLGDLILAQHAGVDGMTFGAAVSTGSRFGYRPMPTDVPVDLGWSTTRLAPADLSPDGRIDVVAASDLGVDASGAPLGFKLTQLLVTGSGLAVRPWLTEPATPFAEVALP